ncbi:hypothetical protein B0H11DRAFT_2236697 [Mycena galericulata]|nr:hypothetical protein B0H11DRAFT_2251498 [Mycena galericulata]KAJ7473159.1 hypothetical protein B0H11DRAFT_2236697 [Mycena galericulata]
MDNTAEPPPQPNLTREENLWFPDATLVIQAETHVFRVSHGILAAKSPVFPQPGDGEMYDGCSLVRLSGSALDTTYFLKAIFHYDFFDPWPADVGFDVVAGILRLSQKYQDVSPILVANLAREVSADWVLPAVLAACAWVALEELLMGVNSAGGRVSLTPSDAVLCLRARDQLQTRWTSQMLDFLWTPLEIPGCMAPGACLHQRVVFRRLGETWRNDQVIVPYVWSEEDWDGLVDNVCHTCLRFMKSSHAGAKAVFWYALPSLFNLPNWDTLLQMRESALK